MECYATTKTIPAQVVSVDASKDNIVAVVSPQDKQTNLVEKLLEQVERLETNKSVPLSLSRATRRGTGSTASRSATAGPEDLSREKQELLWDLVEKNGAHLLDFQRDKFYNLVSNCSCIFDTSDLDLGQTSKLQHCIETGNAAPLRQAVHHLPPA